MNKKRYTLAITAGIGSLCLTAFQSQIRLPIIVYNASGSVPIGYYRVSEITQLHRGSLVLVRTPDSVRQLADQRRYLPNSVSMLKAVAALSGDEVCAAGNLISINGQPSVTRQIRDRAGRPMPRWNGCRTLQGDEVFLLNKNAPFSFDGRYFGVVKAQLVLGEAHPL